MQIVTHARAELARVWSTRLGRISLIALMTTPLWYGGLYLWGNQDPYAHLDRVPAALVVADTGATDDGDRVDYGRDAAEAVLDDGTFDWHEVSASAAASGVKDGTYDFALTFPASFSTDLASAGTTTPTQASIQLTTNDANSYLSTTIAKQAAATVRTDLVQKVGAHASQTLLDSIGDIRDGLVDAASGAQKLADGATDAATGAAKLSTGAETAQSGAADLASGASRASSGADDLVDGTALVASGTKTSLMKTEQLADGLQSLASGATSVSDGADQLASGADSVASGLGTLDDRVAGLPAQTSSLDDGAQQVSAALAQGSSLRTLIEAATAGSPLHDQVAAALGQTASGAAQVAGGTSALASSASGLASGVHQAAAGSSQLASGAGDVADGAHRVASGASDAASSTAAGLSDARRLADGAADAAAGASDLRDGVHDLSSGATKLAAGTTDLASGASDLADGTTTLESGATKLSDSLGSATDDIPDYTTAQRSSIANAIADPAAVDQKAVTEAANYGAGLAPFFISLAAWIGIYALFLILRPLSRRAITAGTSPIRTMIAGWLPPALLGAVQSIALYAVVVLVLGLPMAHPWAALAFMIALSMTYAAIVLALNALLGSVGQFLGLILMIIQLVTAGGTFPWQTLPAPLAAVHQALPMAHAVEAIRQLMYGGSWAVFGQELVPLALWLVGSLAVAWFAAAKQTRFRSLREVRPAAIGG